MIKTPQFGTHNEISGGVRHGPVFQAGNITGAITFGPGGTFVIAGKTVTHSTMRFDGPGHNILGDYHGKSDGVSTSITFLPNQTVYKNGKLDSGSGPKTYQDYQKAHPEAPDVIGPGWPEQ